MQTNGGTMALTIFGIKTCDTCRKAVKALPDALFRDIRVQPLSAEERQAFLEVFGDKLINRASATWRGLSAEARELKTETLLAEHPALMKRPLISDDSKATLGWTAAQQAQWVQN